MDFFGSNWEENTEEKENKGENHGLITWLDS